MPILASREKVPVRDLRNALQMAAIEAHVGYEHEKQWNECDYAICCERKRLINPVHAQRKSRTQSLTANEPRQPHPLGVELLVNCADCGSILNAEICTHGEQAFSKQLLITVARCKCTISADF